MAYEAILRIGDEKRSLLSFRIHYFEGRNATISTWNKSNCFGTLDALLQTVQTDNHAFCPSKGLPYGGLFEIIMPSTSNDDWIYDWFIPSERTGQTTIKKGVVEFYNNEEPDMPFKRIEFWDGWIADISESMSSTGNQPMTMKLRISPATIRYNKTLIVQKNWWQTEIDQELKIEQEERVPFVENIFWKGNEHEEERKDMMLNHNIKLQIQLSDYLQGDNVELIVKQNNGRHIKENKTEFAIHGTCNEEGLVILDNFKVECDFKKGNQNFGNIEFYHNNRKVEEFKENFGWNYIKEEGITKIFVGVEIHSNAFIPKGCLISDIKDAINSCFKRTLENASKGSVTGKIFFIASSTDQTPQVVPSLSFSKLKENDKVLGQTNYMYANINIEKNDSTTLLVDAGESGVHELFHTLRLDHPFEITQAADTKLILTKDRKGFESTHNTDSNIYYNIMNYGSNVIDGKRLYDLWKYKRPEYISEGQIKFILEEIDNQLKGIGTKPNTNQFIYHNYWTKGVGEWIE